MDGPTVGAAGRSHSPRAVGQRGSRGRSRGAVDTHGAILVAHPRSPRQAGSAPPIMSVSKVSSTTFPAAAAAPACRRWEDERRPLVAGAGTAPSRLEGGGGRWGHLPEPGGGAVTRANKPSGQ